LSTLNAPEKDLLQLIRVLTKKLAHSVESLFGMTLVV
jgi:hypothetical protein